MIRFKVLFFFLGLVTISICVMYMVQYELPSQNAPNVLSVTQPSQAEKYFAVDTEYCRIRLHDPLSKSEIQQDFSKRNKTICKAPYDRRAVFTTQRTQNRTCPVLDADVLWQDYGMTATDLNCIYQPVLQDNNALVRDLSFVFGEPHKFDWSSCPRHLEILIICNMGQSGFADEESTADYEQLLLMTEVNRPKAAANPPEERYEKSRFNVLVLGIDSLSRLAFHRTMPNTFRALQNIYGDRLVELLGFNKVGENSAPNQIPMLTGRAFSHDVDMIDYRHFDGWADYIWDVYRRKGFRTLYLEELCQFGLFVYPSRMGFKVTPTDYWPRAFMLAAETFYPQNCYFGQTQSSVYLKYVEDTILLSARDNPLFAYAFLVHQTHDDSAGGLDIDDEVARFFERLNDSGALEHTVVFLLADHGFRLGGFRETQQGDVEDMLPMGFVMLPDEFVYLRPSSLRILQVNSERLVTPFDIHATLRDLADPFTAGREGSTKTLEEANYPNSRYGVSLLGNIVPQSRRCSDAGIEYHFCSCYNNVPETNISIWPIVSQAVVNEVNQILKSSEGNSVETRCQAFTLERMLRIEQLLEGQTYQAHKVRVSTLPSAIFEALINLKSSTNNQDQASLSQVHVLRKSIVRLDRYAEHSQCVRNLPHERYCYCS